MKALMPKVLENKFENLQPLNCSGRPVEDKSSDNGDNYKSDGDDDHVGICGIVIPRNIEAVIHHLVDHQLDDVDDGGGFGRKQINGH